MPFAVKGGLHVRFYNFSKDKISFKGKAPAGMHINSRFGLSHAAAHHLFLILHPLACGLLVLRYSQ